VGGKGKYFQHTWPSGFPRSLYRIVRVKSCISVLHCGVNKSSLYSFPTSYFTWSSLRIKNWQSLKGCVRPLHHLYFACMFVCLFQKRAVPIGPKFCGGPHMTPGREVIPRRHEPRYAKMSMRNSSKCACVINEAFLNLCFSSNKKVFLKKNFDMLA